MHQNKSLIAAVTSVLLNEALASSAHKAMATKAAKSTANSAGETVAQQISKTVMPTDRITIPLERTAKPNKDVVAHLQNHGYHANDYDAGLTSHKDTPNRKIKIGKVLSQTDASPSIKKAFETDPSRSGTKTDSEYKIVISRKPSDIAAMSTHQNWQSCQTLGGKTTFKNSSGEIVTSDQEKGAHTPYVPSTIAAGSHVAYLVKDEKDVDKHMGPIGRVTLNTYVGNSGHKIIRPSTTYGQPWSGFHDTVEKWAETNFPAKDAHYVRHSDAYPEGNNETRSYTPEHDEYWKRNVDDTAYREHPSADVLSHYVSDVHPVDAHHLMRNPHLSKELHSRLVGKVLHSSYRGAVVGNIAPYIGSEHIDTLMDVTGGNAKVARGLARNPNMNHDQLHRLLDTYGAGQTNNPGKRREEDETVLHSVMRHPNSNDSHFDKLFEMDGFHHQATEPEKLQTSVAHSGALETVSNRYHSEETGRKLISAIPSDENNTLRDHLHVIANVARKHPHLLSGLQNGHIADSMMVAGHNNPNLEKIARERNTANTLRHALSHTNDQEFVNQMKTHPHELVANAAKIRQMYFDSQPK